jgi:hypothetical protein
MSREDHRLERLYDYTKFHIGIYITAGTSIVAILGAGRQSSFLRALIKQPGLVAVALVLMMIAGACGGVIVSKCVTVDTFADVWRKKIGPWGSRLAPGSAWATVEHLAFWISLLLLAVATLTHWPTTGVM